MLKKFWWALISILRRNINLTLKVDNSHELLLIAAKILQRMTSTRIGQYLEALRLWARVYCIEDFLEKRTRSTWLMLDAMQISISRSADQCHGPEAMTIFKVNDMRTTAHIMPTGWLHS